jgi:hypothetical protein
MSKCNYYFTLCHGVLAGSSPVLTTQTVYFNASSDELKDIDEEGDTEIGIDRGTC